MKNDSRGEGTSLAPAGRPRAAVCQPAGGRRASWLWRRGVPLIAGLSALAAAAASVVWLWAPSLDENPDEPRFIVFASVLSLCLLACWRVVRHEGSDAAPSAEAEPLGAGGGIGRRAEAVLATVVIGTGVALPAYFLDLPLRVDEARAVANLSSQSFGTVVSWYETPNNHVLHTLFVWVAHQFGGWNRIAWRLPAFFSFCLLLPALWWFVRREHGSTAAAFATVLVAGTPYFVEFATNARGYTLHLFLAVVALLCGQSLVRRPERRGGGGGGRRGRRGPRRSGWASSQYR